MGETLRVVNKIAFVLLFIVACITQAQSQSYPVQVNTALTPPYSAFLADYSAPESQRFTVTFLMKDLTVIDYKGKLRLTIEGVGITIRTKQNFVPVHPITLYGGEPLTLFGSDLEEYFNPNNLDFAGISRSQYEKGAKLPEGVYRFTVEMLDYNRSSLVSNKGTAVAWIILNDPPLLNLPRADTKVKIVDPTNIAFTWTPRHTGSPNSAFTTEYVFKLIEVWPATRNPYDALLSQQPLYEITTSETQIVYGPAEPALIPGRKYAWQVQAKDVDGKDLFKNQGKSEVYAFQFGDALAAPENFRKDGGYATLINLRWEPSQTGAAPQQYRVRYRPTNTDRPDIWYENVTNQLWITIPDLKADTEYDMQIRAEAKPQYSDYSALQSFRTEVKSPARYTCGKEGVYPPGDKSAMLMTLVPGNVITCRGFQLLVTEVAGSAGNFTGKGWVKMMWFNGAGILSTFSGQVNSNYELVTGGYESVYDDGNEAAQDISDAYKIGEQPKQPSTTKDSTTTKVPDYTIAGTIDSVYVNDRGKIVVIDKEGNESTYEQKKDEKTGKVKETVVADASGTAYTVGADGKVTKASGSTGTTNAVAATTIQPDPIKDRIIVLILEQFEEEIGAWLRINGKGGEDDPDVMLALAMPECFEKDARFLQYINENTIPYFKEHPSELRAKIESNQSSKQLLDGISKQFNSVDAVDFNKLSEPNKEALTNSTCEAVNEAALVIIDRLIACLAGATIDVGLQYTFKWVELWMDDKPVNFTDYKAVFGALDASQVAVSASLACAAAMIPIIPSSKNKLIIAVTAGLGDGAFAMANNIYKQYDELEAKYPNASVGELIGKIAWQEAITEGGVNFVITGISTGVVLYAKGNPKFINFAKQLENKIKAKGTAFLKKAGLSTESIDLLLNKLGIRNIRTFLLQLPNTSVSIRNGNINVTDHWSKFATSFDLDESIAQAIRKSTGTSIAELAEEGVIKQFTSNGFVPFITKYGGNNGLDALLANSNDLASATRVILLEIKSSTTKSVPFSVSLGSGYGGYQLDDIWLGGVITKMTGSAEVDKSIRAAGQALRRIYDINASIIEKYVIEVDDEGLARVIRIN